MFLQTAHNLHFLSTTKVQCDLRRWTGNVQPYVAQYGIFSDCRFNGSYDIKWGLYSTLKYRTGHFQMVTGGYMRISIRLLWHSSTWVSNLSRAETLYYCRKNALSWMLWVLCYTWQEQMAHKQKLIYFQSLQKKILLSHWCPPKQEPGYQMRKALFDSMKIPDLLSKITFRNVIHCSVQMFPSYKQTLPQDFIRVSNLNSEWSANNAHKASKYPLIVTRSLVNSKPSEFN